jgi:SPP1 family predicted phage head-tail adaptor
LTPLSNESLSAGRLDKRVTIQNRGETPGAGGTQTIAYTDYLTVWAAIEQGAGREFMAAQQLQPELSHTITIRYRTGISDKQRIKYIVGGVTRTFAIHSVVDPLERHEQLILSCSEIVPTS